MHKLVTLKLRAFYKCFAYEHRKKTVEFPVASTKNSKLTAFGTDVNTWTVCMQVLSHG
jgi:hypothetical protein